MLYALMVGALLVGAATGATTTVLARRRWGPATTRRVFYVRAFASWFGGLAAYAVVTETYRPVLSWTWLGEALLGGDLVPIIGFSALLAYATLRWWGPQPATGTLERG